MPQPSPMSAKAQEELRLLEQDQPGITHDLIGTFVVDAPRQMRQIESAYAAGLPEALKQYAHYLRSGSLVLGLTDVCELSREIEFLAPAEYGSEAANALLQRLRSELQPAVRGLSEQLIHG